MSVLVTPGNLRSALAVTRSLGRRGIPVTVADEYQRNLAAASRYCRAALRVPSATQAPEAYTRAILKAVSGGAYRVVMPMDDVAVSLLAEAAPRLEGLIALPVPDIEIIRGVQDKGALMALAAEQGVPTPKTVVVRNPANLDKAIRHVGLPAVVKPRFSKFQRGSQWIEGGQTRYVHTLEELEAACRTIHRAVPRPVVQEYVPGEGRGIFVLMNRGKVCAGFAHRRIREKPPSGGVSVLSESVPLDPQLLLYSERLLESLKWHGVAMVEFKHDVRDGIPKLLEINGRFWGSLQLAIEAGVDFPYLLYRLAAEGDIAPAFSYKAGVRLRWWLGDLDSLLLRLRDGNRTATRFRAVGEFLKPSGDKARSEVLRRDDPEPALEELRQYVGNTVREIILRVRRGAGDD